MAPAEPAPERLPDAAEAEAEADLPRLRRLLGGPELDWLVERVRRRIEDGRNLDTSVTRNNAHDDERAAVRRLLGRAPRAGRSLSVSLPAVDAVLRTSGACPAGLAAAVTLLTGPVTPRLERDSRLARAWEQAFAPLAREVVNRPELADWYAGLHATGLVRRLTGTPESAAPVLATLARLLPRLPAAPPLSLSTFAAETTGHAHALDQGPLATLALDAIRSLTGTPAGTGAQWRRETWAAAGLLLDELSSQVLTLNLPGDERSATGRALAALGAVGQPMYLTLRQVIRDPPRPPRGGTLYVCENPTVVLAAADRLGPACAPLVCLQGQPSTAALRLLRLYADAGWTLRYHGDFDWGGVRIATRLLGHLPWVPWHYTSADYRAALAEHPDTAPLSGPPAGDAPWDPELTETLREAGRRIEEELDLERLMTDLREPS